MVNWRDSPALARAFVITSCDMSILFCKRSEITCFTYLQILSAQVSG